MKKFPIIVITPAETFSKEHAIIIKMFETNLETLHVRKPALTRRELQTYLESFPKKYHGRLVIHSHYSLLKKLHLKGIHLTEKTRLGKIPAVFKKSKHSLSASFHTLPDIAKTKRKYDYVFLSPVFDSISKKGYKSTFDFKQLETFLKKHRNVIALGGIEPSTLNQVKKSGFRGAATLGYVWESKNPLKAFEKLSSKIK